MKLRFGSGCSHKGERPYLEAFLAFYSENVDRLPNELIIECPAETTLAKTPDFAIPLLGWLIEVKRIVDRDSLEDHMIWGANVTRLENAIRGILAGSTAGRWLLATPSELKPLRGKEINAATLIAQAISQDAESIEVPSVGIFGLKRLGPGPFDLFSMGTAEAKMIDSVGILERNTLKPLYSANLQLGFDPGFQVSKRILLLVDHYGHREHIDSLRHGFARQISCLLDYQNIEEVFALSESGQGAAPRELLYTRSFLSDFESESLEPSDRNIGLLQKWWDAISSSSDQGKLKLVGALKRVGGDQAICRYFSSPYVRTETARLAQWLADNAHIEDAIWVVERLRNDPDPATPDRWHNEIERGDDPGVITTVQGQLAWAVQRLAAVDSAFPLAFQMTMEMLHHDNLYVVLQALVPLIEIVRRRQKLTGYGLRPRSGQFLELHERIFDIVALVARNPQYRMFAAYLSRVFTYYQDLSSDEAKEALQALRVSRDAAGPLVYFCVYRRDHFKDLSVTYDAASMEGLLAEILRGRSKDDSDLSCSIAWHLWQTLNEHQEEFDRLIPWVDILLDRPYERPLYHHLESIVEEFMERRPTESLRWYRNILSRLSELLGDRPDESIRHQVYMSEADRTVSAIARTAPNELASILEQLSVLASRGVYIGDLKAIFASRDSIDDVGVRRSTTDHIRKTYKALQQIYPALCDLD